MPCRDAVAADLQALAQVHLDAWRAAYVGVMDPAFLESLDAEHALSRLRSAMEPQPPLVVVAEHQHELVGFSRFGPLRDIGVAPRTGEVFACNVDPRYWRQGFGRELMAAALVRLHESGYEVCKLWVVERNDRARRFYSALGLRHDGATRVEAAGTAYPLPEMRYSRAIADPRPESELTADV